MARWVVSDGLNAQEATVAAVAVGGVVKRIERACVVDGGIVRQFWPPAAVPDSGDQRIIWNTTPLTVIDSVNDPEDALAAITFNRDTGVYSYNNSPSSDVSGIYLNPAVTGANQYLIRVDQVSGTAVTGTLGAWIDINSAATHVWSLAQTLVGSASAVVDISISQDNGAGAPVATTTVVKRVTYNAAVQSSSFIVWTPIQRDLVEITQTEVADCVLTFNPAGFAVGDADTGSFNEKWHINSPSAANQSDFTVNATLVSGTAPVGSDLGVNLTLDSIREWRLAADVGENFSCELDVTVADIVSSVTKRVTMTATYGQPDSSNVWSSDPSWLLNDLSEGGTAGATIAIQADGTVNGTKNNLPGDLNEDWHSEAPTPSDPENYEGRLDLITGDASAVSGVLNTWFTLPNIVWSVAKSTGATPETWTFNLSIRRIGGAALTKPITVRLTVE